MRISKTVRRALAAALEARSKRLQAALRRTLIQRDFPFVRRFGPDDVAAVHIVYAWETFKPFACALSLDKGYVSFGRKLLAAGPFPQSLDRQLLRLVPASKRDDAFDELHQAKADLYEPWVLDQWKLVRDAAPRLRGFLSVHDTIFLRDLDTGKRMKQNATGFRFD